MDFPIIKLVLTGFAHLSNPSSPQTPLATNSQQPDAVCSGTDLFSVRIFKIGQLGSDRGPTKVDKNCSKLLCIKYDAGSSWNLPVPYTIFHR